LPAAQVEETFPDVQVGVAHTRARDPDQDFAALGLGRFAHAHLQRLAMLDDVVTQHLVSCRFVSLCL
jgi:hypothetical protein